MSKPKPVLSTAADVIAAAKKMGLSNVRFAHSIGGWCLYGGGRDGRGDPLVWSVVSRLGISWGCGGTDYHQTNWRPKAGAGGAT